MKVNHKPNPLFDAVQDIFALPIVTRRDATRVGRIVSDLNAHGATPEQLAARVKAYKRTWPNVACTPEAVVKHWALFEAKAKPDDPWLDCCSGNQLDWVRDFRNEAKRAGIMESFLTRFPAGRCISLETCWAIEAAGGIVKYLSQGDAT